MDPRTILFLSFTVLVCLSSAEFQAQSKCGKGHHVSQLRRGHRCKKCPKGTFMPYEKHLDKTCIACQIADPYQYEVEAAPCTATTNTVIKCQSGFYRDEYKDRNMHHGMCRRCSTCEYNLDAQFEVKICSDYENTLCCPRPTDVAVKDKDGKILCSGNEIPVDVPQRVPPPPSETGVYRVIGCEPGEYMTFYNAGNQQASCRQCPRGTFMDKEKHMEGYCKECSAEEGKILLKKCTPTTDAVFGNVLVVYEDLHKKFDRNGNNGKTISSRAQELRNEKFIVCVLAALVIGKKSRWRWRRWLM